MPYRFPPRREPRILAVAVVVRGLAFVVVDPWVIRGSGRIHCREPSRTAALLRLVRREKPTAVVAAGPALARAAERIARECGIAAVRRPDEEIPVDIAQELFPELPLFAPGDLSPLAALAISAVLHVTPHPRRYAHSRHHASPREP